MKIPPLYDESMGPKHLRVWTLGLYAENALWLFGIRFQWDRGFETPYRAVAVDLGPLWLHAGGWVGEFRVRAGCRS